MRNDRYKLVKSEYASCDAHLNPFQLYDLTPTATNPLGLDNSAGDLLAGGQLTSQQRDALDELKAVLDGILQSEPACPGDGNLDKVVDINDIKGLSANWGKPSVFDFNNDGTTDQHDLDVNLANYGDVCFRTWEGPGPVSIKPVGRQVQVQWPFSTADQLEYSPQLPGANLWSPVSNRPFAIGDLNTLILPASDSKFFRVRR